MTACRGIAETQYWLEMLVEVEIVPPSKMAKLLDETRQLVAIFTSINKHAKSRK